MPGQDPGLEIQAALIAALRADAALAALVSGRVYDEAPQGVDMPFVALGEAFAQPALEANDGEGWELVQVIEAHTSGPGRVEAAEICAAITDLLHERELVLPSHTVVRQRLTFQRISQDPNGVTTQSVQRITFWTCP